MATTEERLAALEAAMAQDRMRISAIAGEQLPVPCYLFLQDIHRRPSPAVDRWRLVTSPEL